MDYGRFQDDEYLITNPRTPRPWHNYLQNRHYLANITQFGSGASFWQPLGEGLRVNVTEDREGDGGPRFLWCRDAESGHHWDLGGHFSHHQLDHWACRVGLGYQVIETEHHGISAAWRLFVPRGSEAVEHWTLTLGNRSKQTRHLQVTPYVEMHLTGGATLMDFISVLGGHFDEELNGVFAINNCVKFPATFKAFLAAGQRVDGCTVAKQHFLGPYGRYDAPLAVTAGNVREEHAGTEWLGASLRHDIELPAGATVVLEWVVGTCSSVAEGHATATRALAEDEPTRRFAALRQHRRELVQGLRLEVGDPQVERWCNIWLKHQLAFVGDWGRVIGRGFRDVLQDTFGTRLTDPARARECLLEVTAQQFPSGRCIRAWRLPHAQLDLQHYADSPSWLAMAYHFYLVETADWSVLDETVPYLVEDDPYAEPTEHATAWEHVLLAQRHILTDRGRHGLPRIRYGDWCDTMNGVGKGGEGESVMLAMQTAWGCDLLAEIAQRRGEHAVAEEMQRGGYELRTAIADQAWDGDWWLRAFDDDGVPVGSANGPDCDDGELRLFLNPQSWALIAGLGNEVQREKSVRAVFDQLDTGYGFTLSAPPSTRLKPRIGQMSAMTPGFYENGSVYVHGTCFWTYALAVAGRADDCLAAWRSVLPDTDNKPQSITEPFTIPNFYVGPAAAERQRQTNLYLSGWRTGSASWLLMTLVEGIMGAVADHDGLRIRPCLPEDWTSASIRRPFRGDIYNITYTAPRGHSNRVQAVSLDGDTVDGDLIPPIGDGGEHQVLVTLG